MRERLCDTQRWCVMPGRSGAPYPLRTRELMPNGFRWPPTHDFSVRPPRVLPKPWLGWTLSERSPDECSTVVEELATRRSQLLEDERIIAPDPGLSGALVAYDPWANLFDGAANEASQGYFDADNVPPWDTWTWFVREANTEGRWASYLVSWVPSAFLARARAGVDANPEGCIAWVSDLRTAFTRKLLDARLV
jgi:hypothetical protein